MLNLLFRVLLLLTIVLVSFRLMGKRQIGSFQPFEFIITLLIADVIAQAVVETSGPIMDGIVPLIGFILFQFVLSLLNAKSKKAREKISGQSIPIMENQKLNQKNIKDLLLSMDDVLEQLRIKGNNTFTDINDIYVETDGSISVITKDQTGITVTLAEDGKIDMENLKRCNLSLKEFQTKMQHMGITSPKQIFWAYYDQNQVTIIPKEKKGKNKR